MPTNKATRAQRTVALSFLATLVIGCGTGTTVGIIEHSAGWGILATIASGMLFVVFGVVTMSIGGATKTLFRRWLRRGGNLS